jgi:hypothetical protein
MWAACLFCLSACHDCTAPATLMIPDVLHLPAACGPLSVSVCSGRSQECEVLLPAVATLLRASPGEYRVLRSHLQRAGSSWLPTIMGVGA